MKTIAAFSICALLAAAPALAQQANEPGLALLPAEPVVRQVLAAMPQLREVALQGELAQASKTALEAGRHEWTVRAGASTRTELAGPTWREQELALERPLRWFGKAAQDAAIGATGVAVAQAAHEDAWHEAGRTLLADWFAALRESVAVARLEEQHGLAGQLLRVAVQRVKAGDGAALEQLQAETEQSRVAAQLQQARQRGALAQQLLRSNYPGLPPAPAASLPVPPEPDGTPDGWIARIVGHNHELELAESEARLASQQARRSGSERMPDPTLSVRASRERGGQERVLGVMLSMPLPGAARKAETRAASARAEQAKERLDMARIRVDAAARRVVLEGAHSRQIWQTLQGMAQQSERQAALTMKAYAAGEVSLSEALLARRQALEAALAAQSAQLEALQAYARLKLDAHLLWAFE
ncbi:MAG TPA: TolC family protein [Burkholderiaceae bacterium]|nr:TolC family protein [Burkholderiaceae bacterium]